MILNLLKRVTEALDEANILYMVSGSMALITYTVPRMTRDIDVVIELSAKDVDRFCAIFKTGYYIDTETVAEEVKRRGMFNVIDHETGYKIDFIVRKNSAYRQNEFDRRIRTNVFGFDLWLVSVEDLIISKIIWIQELQSDRQIDDIENLLTNADADKTYIRNWCQQLHLETFSIKI
jgi:hypothetical protein